MKEKDIKKSLISSIFLKPFVYLYILIKSKDVGLKSLNYIKAYSKIIKNNLFDSDEYLKKYSIDFILSSLVHYLFFGWKEGKYTRSTKIVEKNLFNNQKFV